MSKKTLNQQGACDVPGGAEFDRVQREWQSAKRPPDIEGFIRSRANAPGPTVIDKPCPRCGRLSPHNLTPTQLSECRGCGATWL